MTDKENSQKGQIFVLAVIVLTLILINSLIIISGAMNFFQNSKYSVESTQALNLAEAGIDKAVASLNSYAGNYNPDPNQEVALENGTFTIAVTSDNATTKTILATGYVPNKANSRAKRTVKIQVSKGIGASFNYAIQSGSGGLEMSNNARVNGSVYANGNIVMSNNAVITGDAYVAGGIQPEADQEHDCAAPNCSEFIFGRTSSEADVAQGFRLSTSTILNKVSMKLAKVGSPSDLTIRILGDNGGKPYKNQVLASGTLYSSLVTSNFGFIDVTFANSPTLTANTTYWIVIDTSANSSKYWKWEYDTTQGYTNGGAAYSANWQAGTPVWNTINGDFAFRAYVAGVSTYVQGTNGAAIGGSAYANTLRDISITKGAYYQVIQNVTAGSYYPNSPDPQTQVFPLSDSNIDEWKNLAADPDRGGKVYTGNITNCPGRLNQGKYEGSISLPGGCSVTVGTPIWVTGNLTFGGSNTIRLDPAMGSSSGVFIVDNFISMSNNNKIIGSGTAGSYLIMLSVFDSETDSLKRRAISVSNNGNSGILYANKGDIYIANNNTFTSTTAWKLTLENNVTLNYDQGLAGAFFSSGPSGSFTVIKGSYQDK